MVIINIDTKNDSHEEIKKTIKYLQHLIGEQEPQVSSQTTPLSDTSSFMNIFDNEQMKNEQVGSQSMSIFNEERRTKILSEDEQDAETLLKTISDADVEIQDDDDDAVIEIVEYD